MDVSVVPAVLGKANYRPSFRIDVNNFSEFLLFCKVLETRGD